MSSWVFFWLEGNLGSPPQQEIGSLLFIVKSKSSNLTISLLFLSPFSLVFHVILFSTSTSYSFTSWILHNFRATSVSCGWFLDADLCDSIGDSSSKSLIQQLWFPYVLLRLCEYLSSTLGLGGEFWIDSISGLCRMPVSWLADERFWWGGRVLWLCIWFFKGIFFLYVVNRPYICFLHSWSLSAICLSY